MRLEKVLMNFFSENGQKLAEGIGTFNSNFQQYVLKSKSEFAVRKATTFHLRKL